jgi:NAD(P)-dependent dehydrogenase (short-subunit alcohol dehydrogenase family)
VAATVDQLGALDILVNNAATNPSMGATIDADLGAWDKTFQVNVRGTFVWSQLAWRAWMREHGGSIINLSSIGGLRGDAAIGVYNTTKAAIVHLTRILAVELGPGVRVNAIAPGLVKTDFARALWEPAGDAVAEGLPLRRLGTPEDIAHAARFLAGPGASWITGHTLVVDGGALAGATPITQREFAEPEEG